MQQAVSIKDDEVSARLLNLGLEIGPLSAAVTRAEAARDDCSNNDPVVYPALTAWACGVRALRDELGPKGWRPHREKGLELVLSPCKNIAIAWAAGDAQTSRLGANPRTKCPKGAATETALAVNQLSLFEPSLMEPREAFYKTWFVLVHRDRHEIRFELSLPSAQDAYGHIVGWRERILLPSISLDAYQGGNAMDSEQEIDVLVSLKSD